MYINLCFVMKQISLLEGVSFLYLFADVKKKARISNDRRGKKNCSFALSPLIKQVGPCCTHPLPQS